MKSCTNLEITEGFDLYNKESIDLLLCLIQSQYLKVEYPIFANLELKYLTVSYSNRFAVRLEIHGYYPTTTYFDNKIDALLYLVDIST